MPEFPIVDAHVHLYDPAAIDFPWMRKVPKLDRPYLPADFDQLARPIPATVSGYVQSIDDELLMTLARVHDLVLRVMAWPGMCFVEGSALARAWSALRAPGMTVVTPGCWATQASAAWAVVTPGRCFPTSAANSAAAATPVS